MDPPEPATAWELWALVALFIGSFFFSGTETALTALGDAKARQLRERLGDRGRILDLWIEHPRQVLTTLLIGNNLVNIAATAIATSAATRLFGSAGVGIATGVMTLLVLVFGEITPKTLAREHAEAVAPFVLRVLWPFYVVSYPVAWAFVKVTGGVARLLGAKSARAPVTSEDIDFIIGLGSEVGALEGVKKELLTSVLEFTDLRVKEIMVPRTSVVALDVDTPYDGVLQLIEESEHSRIPVFDGTIDNIIGVLYVKDLLGALRRQTLDAEHFDVREYLRSPFFVPEVMKVSRLLTEMQARRTHLAIVVDEFGGTSGIVTLEDVVEEIVGEIHDEYDVAQRLIRVLPDGKLLVDAGLPLRELEDVLEIEFPKDGDYETVGGFLTATAGQVPPPGSVVAYAGWTFTVRAADEKRVSAVEIERGTPTGDAGAAPGGEAPPGKGTEGGASVAARSGHGASGVASDAAAYYSVEA